MSVAYGREGTPVLHEQRRIISEAKGPDDDMAAAVDIAVSLL